MKLTYIADSFFPFAVPEKDSSFAGSVGPQTVYPAGFSLDQVMQIYWRAQNFHLVASGTDSYAGVTQALSVAGLVPPRNVAVGTDSYYDLSGYTPAGPGDLVTGMGVRQINAGTGTITASGDAGTGTNPAAMFNLQVNLFYPESFVADPIVKYGGLWWPAMSVSCLVTNTVALDEGGSLEPAFDGTTYDSGSTVEIGAFSFFGVSVPVFCAGLAPAAGPDPAETRTFSGSLTVDSEWA